MQILHDALLDAIKKVPRRAFEKILAEKFAQAGVKVSAKSIQKVAEEFLSGARKSFRVPGASHAHVEIEITDEDIVQIEKAIDGFQYDTVLRTLSDDLSNST